MNTIRHTVLRLLAISAVAIAIPQLAYAMGPTSAAMKTGPQKSASSACRASQNRGDRRFNSTAPMICRVTAVLMCHPR